MVRSRDFPALSSLSSLLSFSHKKGKKTTTKKKKKKLQHTSTIGSLPGVDIVNRNTANHGAHLITKKTFGTLTTLKVPCPWRYQSTRPRLLVLRLLPPAFVGPASKVMSGRLLLAS